MIPNVDRRIASHLIDQMESETFYGIFYQGRQIPDLAQNSFKKAQMK